MNYGHWLLKVNYGNYQKIPLKTKLITKCGVYLDSTRCTFYSEDAWIVYRIYLKARFVSTSLVVFFNSILLKT